MLNLKFDNWVVSRLAEPFDLSELGFRKQSTATLVYIDARSVANRLNSVVGAENWSDYYSAISIGETVSYPLTEDGHVANKKPNAYKGETSRWERVPSTYDGIKCDLTVLGITKSDIGSPSNADHLKGATSDALKRAAVKFGIGAYLYNLKNLRGGQFDEKTGRVLEPPIIPEEALPIERPDPKETLLALVEKVRNSNLDSAARLRAENIISHIFVMGRYDNTAPVIVQRAVFEELTDLLP